MVRSNPLNFGTKCTLPIPLRVPLWSYPSRPPRTRFWRSIRGRYQRSLRVPPRKPAKNNLVNLDKPLKIIEEHFKTRIVRSLSEKPLKNITYRVPIVAVAITSGARAIRVLSDQIPASSKSRADSNAAKEDGNSSEFHFLSKSWDRVVDGYSITVGTK